MEAIPISIAAKISEYLVAPIGRQLSYLFQLSGNVETLKNELENLRILRADVEPKVHAAEDNVETISNEVKAWLKHVDSVEGEAQRIVEDKNRFPKGCLSGWLLNINSRHGLSRRAKKRIHDILILQQKGKFTEVSIPAAPILFIGSTSTTSDSRELKLEEIIENLKDQKISMIGICGMGGVGKTTMVKEVFKTVKDENLFDGYAMTVVSQKPDMFKVQRDLAEMLDLKLEEINPVLRASRLNQRLEGKKVLIILDDVWEEFDFQSLGITLENGQRSCKIVFTSRTRGLWMKFHSRRELSLDPLPFNESLNLFKENIGVFLDDKPEFVPIAEQIVKECAGLPLALVTLGPALLDKGIQAWKDTLSKLEKISGVQQKVYESIRQSYDYLGDEEAKSLFLLCSLFEEDSEIFVESLVNMGMGLRLFEGINIVEEARNRVFTLVEHLQSRSLVTKKEAYITVHDVVRDVSKHIASTENGSLVLEQGVTWERSLDKISPEHCTRVSIISNEIIELPSQSQFPNLELLRCSNNRLQRIPDICFEGMAKLQVLDINRSFNPIHRIIYFGSWTVLKLPSSLQSLTSLHTLCLQDFRVEDFTAIKYLQNLEILRIADKDIKELPKEIGQLTKLRLLDMSDCISLKRIAPGIISGLTVLEELYLWVYGIDWGAEENEEGRIAAHKEFKSLSDLYILHIVIKDPSFFPLFKNLIKYKIQIGDEEYSFNYDSQNYERTLSISGVALEKDFKFLLHHYEALLLKGESTKSLVCELLKEASQSIKCLWISETETPEYLANAMDGTKAPFLPSTLESLRLKRLDNLQQIINGLLVHENFAKLKKIDVRKCKQLKYIFRLSNAVNVLHLEELCVNDCESMEEVICWQGREEESKRKLQFPNLKKLKIGGESLISLCKGANEIEFHQLESMRLSSLPAVKTFFPPKVLFPKLVTMHLSYLENMKEIVDGPLEAVSLVKLKELKVRRCNQLKNIFALPTAIDTVHLETLEIKDCESMEEVIKWEGREEDATTKLHFPILGWLEIKESNVICFCRGAKEIEFHQLNYLHLIDLPEVECLVSGSNENLLKSMFPHKVLFPRLKDMELKLMRNVKEIWCDQPQTGSFCNLAELLIDGCDSLEYVFNPFMARYLVHLHTLRINRCRSLKEVVAAEKDKDVEECSNSILTKLQSVTLIGLSALGRFCHIAHDLEFHVLSSVLVVNCPEFKTFALGFVHTPNLKHVQINEEENHVNPGSETLWKGNLNNTVQHLYEDSQLALAQELLPFGKLKRLYVSNCKQPRNICRLSTTVTHSEKLHVEYSEKMADVSCEGREEEANKKSQFPKLRDLVIDGESIICFCKGATEIQFHRLGKMILSFIPAVECITSISDENPMNSIFPPKVLFPRLEAMNLRFMPNVKEVWCGQPQAGSFCNLARLTIRGCDSLEYVFSPFMAAYLVHLHTLILMDCPSLKVVVSAENDKDVEEYPSGILPKLRHIVLKCLSSLEQFCHIAKDLEFLVLGKVKVVNCPEFKTFARVFVHAPKLNHVKLNCRRKIWKGNLNNTVQHLYEDSQLALAELLPIEKLKRLYVSNCKQPRNICRLSTIVTHSEELHVEYSESMAYVSCEGREEEANRKSQFPKLKDLVIDGESIICFCKGATEIEFHQLEKLIILSIPAVECITSISDENPMNFIFPPKVFFPRLVKMKLISMPNMKKIWCGQPQVGSFCNLAKLYIEGCDSLEYVFNPCMATYLVHLHTLSLRYFPSLKEVIAVEKDKDVEEEYSSSILPKLQRVALLCLSALGKFCHIAKDLEFHVLEEVGVINCPEFKTFAPGFVDTPNLKHVIVDYDLETSWKGNLNNTVQHLYEDQQHQRRQKQEDEKEGDNDNEINKDS